MSTIQLIGGPHHGRRLEGSNPRNVIVVTYPVADLKYQQGTYRLETFVDSYQLFRDVVEWKTWHVYLWQDLPADDVTAEEYRVAIMSGPANEIARRPATTAERAQWDSNLS